MFFEGRDATSVFDSMHHSEDALSMMGAFLVGELEQKLDTPPVSIFGTFRRPFLSNPIPFLFIFNVFFINFVMIMMMIIIILLYLCSSPDSVKKLLSL